jgi:hypothetical protein
MEKVEPRRVRVHWTGPLNLEQMSRFDWTNDNSFGLYQVYGHHVVFGQGSLLYIGMARDQPFATRFAQHASWLADEQSISIHLGILAPEDYLQESPNWPDWKGLLADVEALTIHFHSPPLNARNISSYRGQSLLVQNWGNRARLLPEYSSYWPPVKRPDDRSEL